VVEGDVRLHDRFVVELVAVEHEGLHLGHDGRRLGELVVGDEERGAGRRFGLQDPADGVQVVPVLLGLQIDHECHGGDQQVRVEGGHVGAVALTGLENPHDAQRTDPFAERAARHPERLGQVFLDGQP
jgi:hypothetical protein